MQQYKIKINELAEQDLENAGDYIAFIKSVGCGKYC